MAVTYTYFPSQPEDDTIQTWGSIQVTITMTYRERTGAWYMDIKTSEGEVLAVGRRISPNSAPLAPLGLEGSGLPRDRHLLVIGPDDPYAQTDLADTLNTILLTQEEVDEAKAAAQTGTFATVVILGP